NFNSKNISAEKKSAYNQFTAFFKKTIHAEYERELANKGLGLKLDIVKQAMDHYKKNQSCQGYKGYNRYKKYKNSFHYYVLDQLINPGQTDQQRYRIALQFMHKNPQHVFTKALKKSMEMALDKNTSTLEKNVSRYLGAGLSLRTLCF